MSKKIQAKALVVNTLMRHEGKVKVVSGLTNFTAEGYKRYADLFGKVQVVPDNDYNKTITFKGEDEVEVLEESEITPEQNLPLLMAYFRRRFSHGASILFGVLAKTNNGLKMHNGIVKPQPCNSFCTDEMRNILAKGYANNCDPVLTSMTCEGVKVTGENVKLEFNNAYGLKPDPARFPATVVPCLVKQFYHTNEKDLQEHGRRITRLLDATIGLAGVVMFKEHDMALRRKYILPGDFEIKKSTVLYSGSGAFEYTYPGLPVALQYDPFAQHILRDWFRTLFSLAQEPKSYELVMSLLPPQDLVIKAIGEMDVELALKLMDDHKIIFDNSLIACRLESYQSYVTPETYKELKLLLPTFLRKPISTWLPYGVDPKKAWSLNGDSWTTHSENPFASLMQWMKRFDKEINHTTLKVKK